jgi:nucleotide-binding universal stress UspA family protein
MMNILLYAGSAPWRDVVLRFSTPLIAQVAHSLTLVCSDEAGAQQLLDDAAARLAIPAHIPWKTRIVAGDSQTAILTAAHEQPYDLAILGRLNRPLGRLLPGPRSKIITQRLMPSALRVHGVVRPVQRILLASGGDEHTLTNVQVVARLAAPLGASVTVMHVLSQQSICFELIPDAEIAQHEFPHSDRTEATILHTAVDMLRERGVTARMQVRIGPVIDETLAELADGSYDLLVVGAHEPGDALDRLLLEDLTSALLDSSPLPVLVVKNTGRQMSQPLAAARTN